MEMQTHINYELLKASHEVIKYNQAEIYLHSQDEKNQFVQFYQLDQLSWIIEFNRIKSWKSLSSSRRPLESINLGRAFQLLKNFNPLLRNSHSFERLLFISMYFTIL
jgi:hypothetical protein